MESNQVSLIWESQQADAKQRMQEGGGVPGLARMEQLTGKSGREILEAMMAGGLPYANAEPFPCVKLANYRQLIMLMSTASKPARRQTHPKTWLKSC